jgi:hypothetical protein
MSQLNVFLGFNNVKQDSENMTYQKLKLFFSLTVKPRSGPSAKTVHIQLPNLMIGKYLFDLVLKWSKLRIYRVTRKTYKNFCFPENKHAHLVGALLSDQPKLWHHKQLYTFVCLFD